MKKYEYYTFVYDTTGVMGGKVDERDLQKALNDLGQKGWELVSSVATNQGNGFTRSIVCILKREIAAV